VEVLDVRNDDEWARGHIAGSRHIPLHALPQQIDHLAHDRPVVVHCASGTRSAIAASLLTAHGFTDVLDLAGGFDAWQAAQEPVEQEADVEHIDA
jgi:hydroxyacylglutathione hydrolase